MTDEIHDEFGTSAVSSNAHDRGYPLLADGGIPIRLHYRLSNTPLVAKDVSMCLPPENRKTVRDFADSQILRFSGVISAVPTQSVGSQNHRERAPLINSILSPDFNRLRHLRTLSVGVKTYRFQKMGILAAAFLLSKQTIRTLNSGHSH
jgi:hypothetical protein